MFLTCGGEPQKSQTDTRRTCGLHRERFSPAGNWTSYLPVHHITSSTYFLFFQIIFTTSYSPNNMTKFRFLTSQSSPSCLTEFFLCPLLLGSDRSAGRIDVCWRGIGWINTVPPLFPPQRTDGWQFAQRDMKDLSVLTLRLRLIWEQFAVESFSEVARK